MPETSSGGGGGTDHGVRNGAQRRHLRGGLQRRAGVAAQPSTTVGRTFGWCPARALRRTPRPRCSEGPTASPSGEGSTRTIGWGPSRTDRMAPHPHHRMEPRGTHRRTGLAGAPCIATLVCMTTQSCSSPPPLPRPVSDAYPRQLDAEREAAMRTATHPGSEFDGAPAPLHDRLESLIDAGAAEMTTLMLDLAEHPEVAFEEHRSARAIVDVLAAHGIEAQLGVHGL